MRTQSRRSGASCPGRGANSFRAHSFAFRFHGQTSWHASQPNAHGAIPSRIGFHCSIVRYGMHRRASMTRGATNASVGQEERHRSQEPHRSG